MKEYGFKGCIVEFFKRAYEGINTNYRMARFEGMLESGELEHMRIPEVHKRFGVRGEGDF